MNTINLTTTGATGATFSGLPTGVSGSWSGNTATISGTPTVSGTFNYTVTTTGGCPPATATATITVNPQNTIATGVNRTVCINSSMNTINLTTTGATGATFSGLPTGVSGSWSGNTATISGTPTVSGTFNYTVTTTGGCPPATATATITVNPTPIVNPGQNQTICQGSIVALNASGADSYAWSNNLSNGQPFIPNETSTYTVIGTNSFGCSSSATTIITVNTPPTLSVVPDQTICEGDATTLFATGANVYEWTGGVINNVPFFPTTTNSYQVTGIDLNGCSSFAQVTVNVLPAPIANAGQNGTITCSSNNTGIQIGSTSISGVSYSWSPAIGLNIPNIANPIANPESSQIYQVILTGANGCVAQDEVSIIVDNNSPTIFAGNNATINCLSNVNGVQLGTQPQSNYSYNWSPASGLSNPLISSPNANPSQSTQYILNVINNLNGCASIDSVFVAVDNALPIVSAGADTSICQGSSFQINGLGIGNLSWSPSSSLSNPSILSPLASPTFNTTYTLTVIGANGCQNSDEVNVIVNEIPPLSLGQDLSICNGDSINLQISSLNNNLVWSGIASNASGNNITITPSSSGYVVATLTDPIGCQNADSIFINVLIPNIPSIIGENIVCQNQMWSLYSINSNNSNISWNVQNGTILGSNSPFDILVHWDFGNEGLISYNALNIATNCPVQNELTISLEGEAPDTSLIQRIPNTNVLYAAEFFPIMRWGYTNSITGTSVNTCQNDQYCEFSNFDPALFTYWVEAGDDEECLTKSYFNRPSFYLGAYEEDNSYNIFPNPCSTYFVIQSPLFTEYDKLEIINTLGQIVIINDLSSNYQIIDISSIPNGIYFVRLSSFEKLFKLIKE
jgi:hypothetical protein